MNDVKRNTKRNPKTGRLEPLVSAAQISEFANYLETVKVSTLTRKQLLDATKDMLGVVNDNTANKYLSLAFQVLLQRNHLPKIDA